MSIADLTLTVAQRTEAASGVVHLVLTSADGQALPTWEPGAHVDVVLTPTLVRQYSLCGDPTDAERWEVAVLREPSGQGSVFVHESLSLGRPVRVRGPRNHFPLQPAADYLFIAGGIGITPILPMLAAATAAGASWRLVYGGRTRDSMAFAGALTTRYPDQVDLVPQDTHGLIDLDALLGKPSAGTLVYCCGPSPLLDAVSERMAELAGGFAAPRTVHDRTGRSGGFSAGPGEHVVRGGAQPVSEGHHRRPGRVDPRGGRAGGHQRAVLLPRRQLRHVRDRRARRCSGASRRGADGRRARGERRHDDLRLTRGLPAVGPGSLSGSAACRAWYGPR